MQPTPDKDPTAAVSGGTLGGSELDEHILTKAQKRIVNFAAAQNHILCVNAGPGSGKTATLVRRIAALTKEVDPREILVLSMANRSVNAIRKSLKKLLDQDESRHPDVFTFHSFCGVVLDENASSLSHRVVIDNVAWRNLSRLFLGKSKLKIGATITPSMVESIIHAVKTGSSVEEQAQKHDVDTQYIELVLEYLRKNRMMRYSDLVTSAIEVLALTPNIPRISNYKIVVVDEFQDTYPQLLSLIKEVVRYPTTGEVPNIKKHLTIAGDPNQTIYEFLGADPSLMFGVASYLDMESTELPLDRSFRCSSEVLRVASSVGLATARLPIANAIGSVKLSGSKPIIQKHHSAREEQDFIASEIARLICLLGGLLAPSDIAVLTRTNRELEEITQNLTQNYGYQCNRFSLSPSWVKSRVHILLDLLIFLNGGLGLEFALLCVLSRLDTRAGSSRRISKLFHASNSWTQNKGMPMEDCLRTELHNGKTDLLAMYKGTANQPFLQAANKLLAWAKRTRNSVGEMTPVLVLKCLLDVSHELNLLDYLNKPETTGKKITTASVDTQAELESNLTGFYKSLCACHKSYLLDTETTSLFLEHFLRNYNDEPPIIDRNKINVSTVHTAKGLEFPVVFIAGVKDNHASYWSPILENDMINDEARARLFYVACTRARCLLYMASLKRILPEKREAFQTALPTKSEIVNMISRECYRAPPTDPKLVEGQKLFDKFSQLGLIRQQQRSFHTRSLIRLTNTFARRRV